MSKHFKKLNIEACRSELVKHAKPPKVEEFPRPEEWQEFSTNIRDEIRKMQVGESDYFPRALHLTNGTCITMTVLDRFFDSPSRKALKTVIVASEQDFGSLAADEFRTWANEILQKHELKVLRGDIRG